VANDLYNCMVLSSDLYSRYSFRKMSRPFVVCATCTLLIIPKRRIRSEEGRFIGFLETNKIERVERLNDSKYRSRFPRSFFTVVHSFVETIIFVFPSLSINRRRHVRYADNTRLTNSRLSVDCLKKKRHWAITTKPYTNYDIENTITIIITARRTRVYDRVHDADS